MYYKIFLTKDLRVKEEWVKQNSEREIDLKDDELFAGFIGEPHFSCTADPEKQVWGKMSYGADAIRKIEWSGFWYDGKEIRARTEKEYFERARDFLLKKVEEVKKVWEEVYAEQEKAKKGSPFRRIEAELALQKLEAIREAIKGNKETVSVHRIRRILEG
ncbi:MAG: hypothetical protein DRI22_00085 [Caldiserica bacterium]|nr:MAG: hypothetical protein DRI22_00085 [Caldisericota bacterium]